VAYRHDTRSRRPIQHPLLPRIKTNSNAPKTLYPGLDVDKAETVIAILESERDAEPRHYGSIATTQHALERAMRRIAKNQKRELSDLHVCYEASGCGFWIARRLLQMGIRCDVIAPSLIPVKSGDRIKTDKRDAMKLAKNLRSNDLVAVNIPDSVDARHDRVTGTFSRFEHPKKLMAFLGLVPTESSSGTSKREGGISKCGN